MCSRLFQWGRQGTHQAGSDPPTQGCYIFPAGNNKIKVQIMPHTSRPPAVALTRPSDPAARRQRECSDVLRQLGAALGVRPGPPPARAHAGPQRRRQRPQELSQRHAAHGGAQPPGKYARRRGWGWGLGELCSRGPVRVCVRRGAGVRACVCASVSREASEPVSVWV